MKNFEKYKDDILKLIEKGQLPVKKGDKIVACLDTPCAECDFIDERRGCMFDSKWYFEDDGEPTELERILTKRVENLQNENEKLTAKIQRQKNAIKGLIRTQKTDERLQKRIEHQRKAITKLIEEQKEKYEAGWDDGYYACWRDCEKRQNLRAGDVIRVKDYPLRELLVTEVGNHVFYGMDTKTGAIFSDSDIEDWEQTGRHIDIQEILKLIPRGEENDNR